MQEINNENNNPGMKPENGEWNCNDMIVGYAYVRPQTFGNLYSNEEAMEKGTLFQDLDLPMGVYGPVVS